MTQDRLLTVIKNVKKENRTILKLNGNQLTSLPAEIGQLENLTTYPKLSDRRNIIVIADEAHRSQYEFIDGFARHMRDGLPNASFIGFTGTPIENTDRNTPAVFGNYIDTYDILRSVEDRFEGLFA